MDDRFPLDPPKGKGGRVADAVGTLLEVLGPQLQLVEYCKDRYLRLYGSSNSTPRMSTESGSAAAAAVARSLSLIGRDQQRPAMGLGSGATGGTYTGSPPHFLLASSAAAKLPVPIGRLGSIKEVPSDVHHSRASALSMAEEV